MVNSKQMLNLAKHQYWQCSVSKSRVMHCIFCHYWINVEVFNACTLCYESHCTFRILCEKLNSLLVTSAISSVRGCHSQSKLTAKLQTPSNTQDHILSNPWPFDMNFLCVITAMRLMQYPPSVAFVLH